MIIVEVVATAIYWLNFYFGLSTRPVTTWIIQGCGAIVKMTQLQLRVGSCWFSWVWLWLRIFFSWLQLRLLVVFTH